MKQPSSITYKLLSLMQSPITYIFVEKGQLNVMPRPKFVID